MARCITSLDFVGFYDPVTRLKSMNILDDFEWPICSTTRSVLDDRGLRMEATAIEEPLDSYDLLFVPGGFGTRELQHDAGFVAWLKTGRRFGLDRPRAAYSAEIGGARGAPAHRVPNGLGNGRAADVRVFSGAAPQEALAFARFISDPARGKRWKATGFELLGKPQQ